MKPNYFKYFVFKEELLEICIEAYRQKLPLYLLIVFCFNLVLAPIVYAASSNELSKTQAWSIGLLGLGTLGLSIYLFFVVFEPEKF